MKVLAGVQVLDLGHFITGPYSAMLLAELGADVIKVERPGSGDAFRAFEGSLYSPQFQSHNRHKRSLTLDFTQPEGRAVLMDLVRSADVMIVNNRPGVSEKLGIDHETLRAVNPRLIYCSITGFGPDGPAAGRPAYDTVGQAASGWISLFHDGDDARVAGPAVCDGVTGVFACLGMLGALFERERSGQGRKVEISMVEASMAMAVEPIGHYLATGVAPSRYTRGAISQAYVVSCADGNRICLHMSSPEKFWQGLATAIGDPGLLQRYPDRAARIAGYEQIGHELNAIFGRRPRSDWEPLLAGHDVPYAPERRIDELEQDPQIRHLDMFYQLDEGPAGTTRGLKRPVRYDGRRNEELRPAPLLGEHTRAILQELSIEDSRIEELERKGLV